MGRFLIGSWNKRPLSSVTAFWIYAAVDLWGSYYVDDLSRITRKCDNIVTCFKVTRHRHVSRLVADSRSRGNESAITFQRGWRPVISLRSTRGHFRPNRGANRAVKEEFGIRVRSSSRLKVQFKSITWRMPSSGMWCRMTLVRTDVSEERVSSIIRVKRISELGKT
jgi:hypothetical protein